MPFLGLAIVERFMGILKIKSSVNEHKNKKRDLQA
jgi:hypothetical protein